MAETTDINEGINEGSVTPQGNPPVKSEEVAQLEAQKAQLEVEIAGLEGTKNSVLEDVERARVARREATAETPPVDVEALKQELAVSLEAKLAERDIAFAASQAKLQEELIKAKKATLESINARMASVSGSSGPASPDSIVENKVELSTDESKVAQEVGLKNPRYLKETEVRGM